MAILLLAAAMSVPSTPAPVRAEPYLAVRTGLKCAVCHVNGTGGGKRTAYGLIYSQTGLPARTVGAPDGGAAFDPELSEDVSVGGDLRVVNDTVLRGGKDTNGFAFSEANAYVQVALVRDAVIFYVDEKLTPGAATAREAVLLLQNAHRSLYFKAGRMLLPYGFSLWDNEAFIRGVTGFHYEAQDVGVEIGWEPGPVSLWTAATNGTGGGDENNRDKQITARGSWLHRRGRVGGSFSVNQGPDKRRTVGGAFGGLNSGRVTLLGEYDWVHDGSAEAERYGEQRVAYVEADVLVAHGVNVKLAYDWWDPFSGIDEDERVMFRVGIEPFLTQLLQVRAFYRFRDAPPQLVADRHDQLSFELHAFF